MISDNAQSHIFAKRSAPRLMAFRPKDPPAPPRLDRSWLSIAIDNFPAFSRVRDQQTAAEVAQMKDQMVAVDQAEYRDPVSG
jgi:hypothetical protein